MSNEQSLRELKIFRERSCNGSNRQSSQQQLKKGRVYLKSFFFTLKKLSKKIRLEFKLYKKLQSELKKHSLKQEFDKKKIILRVS